MYPLNIVPDQLFPFGFEKIRKILIKSEKPKQNEPRQTTRGETGRP